MIIEGKINYWLTYNCCSMMLNKVFAVSWCFKRTPSHGMLWVVPTKIHMSLGGYFKGTISPNLRRQVVFHAMTARWSVKYLISKSCCQYYVWLINVVVPWTLGRGNWLQAMSLDKWATVCWKLLIPQMTTKSKVMSCD